MTDLKNKLKQTDISVQDNETFPIPRAFPTYVKRILFAAKLDIILKYSIFPRFLPNVVLNYNRKNIWHPCNAIAKLTLSS